MKLSLKDVIIDNIAAARANIYTSIPAIVTKVYDEGNTTVVDANLAISRVGMMDDYGITTVTRVPLMFPKSGGCSVTLPIVVGNEVMLHFAMRDSGEWRYSGGKKPVLASSNAVQDVSDAYATPTTTTYSTGSKIDPDAVVIDSGETKIRILKNGNIELGGNASEQLVLGNKFMTLYNEMVSLVKSHTHVVPQSPSGTQVAPESPDLAVLKSMTTSQLSSTNKTN